MTAIKPFKGILYNKEKIDRLRDVIAPPYDVITPEMQRRLHDAHPFNIVRLILGKEDTGDNAVDNKYTRARRYLNKWLKKGILAEEAKEALYIYNQEYKEDGTKKKRVGFISLMKLEGLSKRAVLLHEKTFKRPKEDRLRLIREVKANLSPIFAVYRDSGKVKKAILAYCQRRKPAIDLVIDKVRHKFWALTEDKAIAEIKRYMSKKQIFIADGHHRYKVALAYRNEMRKSDKGSKRYDYIMTYLTDMTEKGLTILPSHRLVKSAGQNDEISILKQLERYFTVKRIDKPRAITSWLKAAKGLSHSFGLYINGRFFSLRLKSKKSLRQIDIPYRSDQWKALDVSVLHYFILKKLLKIRDREGNICYARDAKEAMREVDRGSCKLAFLLNPTKISQVRSIAQKRELMPHKSTYFYPKLLSGLVINKF